MGRKTKIIVLCLLLPVVIVLLGVLLSWYFCRNKKTEESLEEELELPMFDWSVMLRATNNFSNKIGQGGFGVVYKVKKICASFLYGCVQNLISLIFNSQGVLDGEKK